MSRRQPKRVDSIPCINNSFTQYRFEEAIKGYCNAHPDRMLPKLNEKELQRLWKTWGMEDRIEREVTQDKAYPPDIQYQPGALLQRATEVACCELLRHKIKKAPPTASLKPSPAPHFFTASPHDGRYLRAVLEADSDGLPALVRLKEIAFK